MNLTSLGYATDLALLAHGGSLIEREDGYWRVTSPHNPTHYWGNFLLLDAPGSPAAAEELFRRALPNASHVALGIDRIDLRLADLTAYAEAGFEVFEGTVLVATSIIEVPPPPGATIRQLITEADWAQSVALSMATRDEKYEATGFLTYLEAKMATQQRLSQDGRGAWFGAFVDEALVAHMGLFDCGEGRARFQTVETHPDFRRRGMASATLSAIARYATETLGTTQLVIVADPDYVAIDLYRSLGFVVRESQVQMQRLPT